MLDGPTLVHEALDNEHELREVFAEPDAPADLVDKARSRGVLVHAVAAGVLAKATDPVTPQAIAAIAAIPPAAEATPGLVLVLVDVADPGNVGTLVRVAEAVDAAVWCTGSTADVWSPKTVRSSAGSVLRVPVVADVDTDDALAALAGRGHRIVTTALVAPDGTPALDPERTDLRGSVALVLGNEAHGLPEALVAAADDVVRIPMAGQVESLNVAMAGTVLAFEAARQRRTDP